MKATNKKEVDGIISDIKTIRKKKGITQKKLSEMTGINRVSLAKIENGITEPLLSTIRKILVALDRDIKIVHRKKNM